MRNSFTIKSILWMEMSYRKHALSYDVQREVLLDGLVIHLVVVSQVLVVIVAEIMTKNLGALSLL